MADEEEVDNALRDVENVTDHKIAADPVIDTKYLYSPVPSDCMACATREKSRRYKELEAQKNEIVCEPLEGDSGVCYAPDVVDREKRLKLHLVTTNRRFKVFGKWDEGKLLALLMSRLLEQVTAVPPHHYEKIPSAHVMQPSTGVPYDPVIHRGIYSEKILRILYSSGVTEQQVVRAMKFGLRHLEPEELVYFERFGVTQETLHMRKLWSQILDDELFENLRAIGLEQADSQKVVVYGILALDDFHTMQLILAGIDVPGIFDWKGPRIPVTARMIKFLRKLGTPEDILQLIVQKGIDEESKEMLRDLGYTETEEEEHLGMMEVITCECSLTILESEDTSVCTSKDTDYIVCGPGTSSSIAEALSCVCGKKSSSKTSSSVPCSMPSMFRQPICICHMHPKQVEATDSEIAAQRNDYLRQSVMIPLAWAMGRALRYRPSDPKHYIAHQLLRWKSGNVPEEEMNAAREFIVAATIKRDAELVAQRQKAEEEMIARMNEEALKLIPCQPCIQRQQLHRIKERCWKCIKKWVPRYEPCEFSDVCSSCKVNLSDILRSVTPSTTTVGSTVSSIISHTDSEPKVPELEKDSFVWRVPRFAYEEGEGEGEGQRRPRYDIYKEINQEDGKHPEICCPFPCDFPVPSWFKELQLEQKPESPAAKPFVSEPAEINRLPSFAIDPDNPQGPMRCKEFHDCGSGPKGVIYTCREPTLEPDTLTQHFKPDSEKQLFKVEDEGDGAMDSEEDFDMKLSVKSDDEILGQI